MLGVARREHNWSLAHLQFRSSSKPMDGAYLHRCCTKLAFKHVVEFLPTFELWVWGVVDVTDALPQPRGSHITCFARVFKEEVRPQ